MKFKDKHGKEWEVNLDLAAAWKIEEYDFQGQCPKLTMIPPQEDLLTKRITDTKTLFGIAWCLVTDQVHEHNSKLTPIDETKVDAEAELAAREKIGEVPITNEFDFAKRFNGPAIAEMKLAVWGTFENFFPEMATTLKHLTERFSTVARKLDQRLGQEVLTKLSDAEIDKMLDKAAEELPTLSAASTSTMID